MSVPAVDMSIEAEEADARVEMLEALMELRLAMDLLERAVERRRFESEQREEWVEIMEGRIEELERLETDARSKVAEQLLRAVEEIETLLDEEEDG